MKLCISKLIHSFISKTLENVNIGGLSPFLSFKLRSKYLDVHVISESIEKRKYTCNFYV